MHKENEQGFAIEEKAEGCCGGPAPAGIDACCAADSDAKIAGDEGCGCGTSSPSPAKAASSCC